MTEKLAEIKARWMATTTGPWKAVPNWTGEDWLIASFGNSGMDGQDWYLTTHCVHASELDGDAKADAEAFAKVRDDLSYLYRLAALVPELLEAAIAVTDAFGPDDHPALVRLDAAIAKVSAEGGR